MAKRKWIRVPLDKDSKFSLQQQLYDALKKGIQTRQFRSEEALPSTRELAMELGVSRNTVIAAYDRLLGEGYLESIPRSGMFVSSGLQNVAFPSLSRSSSARALSTIQESPVSMELARPVPFRPSQPDVSLFPWSVWNRMRNRAMRKAGLGVLDYQSKYALGLPVLRKAIAQYLSDSRGVRCHWSQIMITTGSQQALFLIGQGLIARGDTVLLEDPGYLGARNAFVHAGARIRGIPVDDHGLVPSAAKLPAALFYTTPSRQFPTGACLPTSRRLEILEVAAKAQAWLIEDDYDSEFRYATLPVPSLHGLDSSHRVIYVGSMSKVLYPSLRIGYMVLPEKLIDSFERLRLIVEDHGPLVDQVTLAEFLESGQFYTHVRRCRKSYAAKLDVFLSAVHKHRLPLEFPHIEGGVNQAGLFPSSEYDPERISMKLEKNGFYVPSLSRYSLQSSCRGLLFGFTAFDFDTLRTAVARMAPMITASQDRRVTQRKR
jgi:GntR family transcriptional regulator/MocR family aminotransferase